MKKIIPIILIVLMFIYLFPSKRLYSKPEYELTKDGQLTIYGFMVIILGACVIYGAYYLISELAYSPDDDNYQKGFGSYMAGEKTRKNLYYQDAVNYFKKVSKDYKNYNQAQEFIRKSEEKLSKVHDKKKEQIDAVYLKNGNILKGKIIEIVPDEHIKIEIEGGSIMVIKYNDIQKMEINKKP